MIGTSLCPPLDLTNLTAPQRWTTSFMNAPVCLNSGIVTSPFCSIFLNLPHRNKLISPPSSPFIHSVLTFLFLSCVGKLWKCMKLTCIPSLLYLHPPGNSNPSLSDSFCSSVLCHVNVLIRFESFNCHFDPGLKVITGSIRCRISVLTVCWWNLNSCSFLPSQWPMWESRLKPRLSKKSKVRSHQISDPSHIKITRLLSHLNCRLSRKGTV